MQIYNIFSKVTRIKTPLVLSFRYSFSVRDGGIHCFFQDLFLPLRKNNKDLCE